MRLLVLVLAAYAVAAHAEIYRWVERDTGTVKFSNIPPPWYGDAEKERDAPAVEVIRYRGAAAPTKPAAPPRPAGQERPVTATALSTLEARRAELARFFATLPPSTDFAAAGSGLRRLLEDYQALSAELDRVDPAGAPRRRALDAGTMERLRRGLEAQFSEKPPAQ